MHKFILLVACVLKFVYHKILVPFPVAFKNIRVFSEQLYGKNDTVQTNEIIADNDAVYQGEGGRFIGGYEEIGSWTDAGAGFADTKAFYTGTENPFSLGTARKCECIESTSRKTSARIIWKADVPERGEYAVYVSYKTLPESTSAAHYTVHHLGGQTEFTVNQKKGGGIWIYLGTFEFDKGRNGYVSLDNRTPEGYSHKKRSKWGLHKDTFSKMPLTASLVQLVEQFPSKK